ncbi:hypothetical protein JW897_12345 [Chromobacterium alkanivorans]|uniref:hypothetical protein n=1 Tax=Chromobacterium alkanivorans TaxID=1071719 RepID=UPI0019676A21|nr:hypothetical protein [Chromobacterium alkanivorans]MBN3004526.1 hypothetical protein [Chromobacterium alkanivorans]
MTKAYVQFSDAAETTIICAFSCPQDPNDYPNQGEVDDTDSRYQAFKNPPSQQMAAIKAQLEELDKKASRPLLEAILVLAASGTSLPADTVKRLQDIEDQKAALRGKLVVTP